MTKQLFLTFSLVLFVSAMISSFIYFNYKEDILSLVNSQFAGVALATNGLIAHYPFDDGESQGKVSQAKNFDKTNYFDAGKDLLNLHSLTFCAWINPRSGGINNGGVIATNGKFTLSLIPMGFSYALVGSTGSESAFSAEGIELNLWQHVCITRSGLGKANIFINGVLSGEVNQKSGLPTLGHNLFIGNRMNGDLGFDGLIDDVKIYNRILSNSQIKQIYKQLDMIK